jgi:hypothetical protein
LLRCHGLNNFVATVCLSSTTPVPLRKIRALVTSGNVTSGNLAATAAGFRLRLGGGVALRLRSSRLSACASLLPLADRRPKPFKKDLTTLLH